MSYDLNFVDKYHPKTIDDIVLNKNLKDYFKEVVKTGHVNNMTLAGSPGIGKTTICDVIAKTVNASVLFIPCGIRGTIDVIRGDVKNFVDAFDLEDRQKIIILDEADSLTGGNSDSNSQKALRSLMGSEANKEVKWLLTCNFPNKLIEPIKSRCPVINLAFGASDLLERVIYILKEEKIKFSKDQVVKFIELVLKKYYPDIRKILTILQNCCISGELKPIDTETIEDEYDKFLNELMNKFNDNVKLRDVMHFVESNKSAFNGNYVDLECKILKQDSDKFTVPRVERLVDNIYKTQNSADPLIMFTGFVCIMLNKEYD